MLKPKRRRRKPEPGEAEWKQPHRGFCAVCRRPEWRLHRHHIVHAQHVRRAGGNPWDPRDGLDICSDCHERHHNASRRLPLSAIPNDALAFAVQLFGVGGAVDYLRRYYRGEDQRLVELDS